MTEKIARRMQRFYRRQQEEEAGLLQGSPGRLENTEMEKSLFEQFKEQKPEKPDKKHAMNIAVNQVREFQQAHNRLPRKDEYDQIADNIYNQLKEQGQLEGPAREEKSAGKQGAGLQSRGRTREERIAARQGTQAKELSQQQEKNEKELDEIKEIGIKDLLKEDLGEKEEDKEPQEFSEEESEDFNLEGMNSGENETAEEKCPNCGKETEEIIFCPNCGSAFCEQCAKAERIGSEKKIACPKCKKQIKK